MHPTVQFALRAARSAAEQFLRIRERVESAHDQLDLDGLLETAARNAETLITQQLARGYPQHGVVGRFTPHRDGEGEGCDTLWRIEPLHGYSNLRVAGNAFALSLVCLVKGRAEHAIILRPFSDDEYLISRGRGAQHNGHRLRVSRTTRLEGVRLFMGLPESAYRERQLPAYLHCLQRLGPRVETLIATGCPLLDLADMASGRGDAALVLGIEEQDLLVGSLLLKESGALLGSPEGVPSVAPGGNLLAASPRLYKEAVKALKAAA